MVMLLPAAHGPQHINYSMNYTIGSGPGNPGLTNIRKQPRPDKDRMVRDGPGSGKVVLLRTVRGREKIEELCADILQDESNLAGAWCRMAAWPETPRQVRDTVDLCAGEGLHVTVSGGLTGIAGGALPEGGAVISTSMLRDMEMLDSRTVRAGAGVTLQELRGFLAGEAGEVFYPPDPTEETASVGGTIATDASGSDSYLYGATRKWTRSLTVMVPDHGLLEVRRGEHLFSGNICRHPVLGDIRLPELVRPQPPKNAAGYNIWPDMDLLDLFIGSEGTLGVIVQAELELAPVPEYVIDLAVFPGNASSFWDLFDAMGSHVPELRLRALEMMDDRCVEFLREHPGELPPLPEGARFVLLLRAEARNDDEMERTLMTLDDALVDCGVDPNSAWGGFEPSERKRIRDFRHALPESVNHRISQLRREFPGIHKFGSDGAVKPGELREYYARTGEILTGLDLPFLIFGHSGQGHLHANAIPEDPDSLHRAEEAMRDIAAAAVGMEGTISAEHGLGRLKLPYLSLMYSPGEIAGMEAIRRTIDPHRTLARAMEFPVV